MMKCVKSSSFCVEGRVKGRVPLKCHIKRVVFDRLMVDVM
jgi:hypothetical protein